MELVLSFQICKNSMVKLCLFRDFQYVFWHNISQLRPGGHSIYVWFFVLFANAFLGSAASGVTGVGKSVVTVDALEKMRKEMGVIPYTINFSAQTQAKDTQFLIESKLEKKRKTK